MYVIEQELEVYVSPAGNVCIARQDMNEDCFFAVPPEEVDMLCRWLQQKKAEAMASQHDPLSELVDVD
jgi:hypothetical protein